MKFNITLKSKISIETDTDIDIWNEATEESRKIYIKNQLIDYINDDIDAIFDDCEIDYSI